MRGLVAGIRFVVAALACSALCAQDTPASENEICPGRINRPQDFAPAELVIVPRPPEEYLPAGSLLATGARAGRQVDLEELRERKLSMYTGRPETRSLPSAADSPTGPQPLALDVPVAPPGTNFGVLVFRSLVSSCVAATLWLVLRILVALRTRTAPSGPAPRNVAGH